MGGENGKVEWLTIGLWPKPQRSQNGENFWKNQQLNNPGKSADVHHIERWLQEVEPVKSSSAFRHISSFLYPPAMLFFILGVPINKVLDGEGTDTEAISLLTHFMRLGTWK
jgi:hypothetical protein